MTDDPVAAVRERFLLHWGEMGTRWGVNRTVAQVHALLYISPAPVSANEIMEQLTISRGNVSMALKELEGWGLVQLVLVKGDRKEYYTTEKDVWALFRRVAAERKRREIDPTLSVLRACVADLDPLPGDAAAYEREQLGRMLEFFEVGDEVYRRLESQSPRTILNLVGLARRLRFIGGG